MENILLDNILIQREQRMLIKKKLASENKIIISFSLNIPGIPKKDELIDIFFETIKSEIKIWLAANRINIVQEIDCNDILAGNYVLWTLRKDFYSAHEIKRICELFENKHYIGRVIDLDVCNEKAENISSGKLKKCFICQNEAAIICMRERKHTYSELRDNIFTEIRNYLYKQKKNNIINKLVEFAIKSMIYEVSFSPKPGLVDFFNDGSHSDMNYYMFINSTATLAPFIRNFAELGYDYEAEFTNVLALIREIGIQMEQEMFKTTNNVNTQKGLIFLLGISVFSVAYILSKYQTFSEEKFVETVKLICKDIVNNELNNKSDTAKKTNGELCFLLYGFSGIRAEVEQGMPTVFNYSIKTLRHIFDKDFFNDKQKISYALEKTLLTIIAHNNDSNIVYRKGIETLEQLKLLARQVIDNKIEYSELIKFCEKYNISPGGSADLLVVSLFLFFVEKEIYI